MERLTVRECGITRPAETDATIADILVKLAAYEDTGLTPEEIKDHEEVFKAYRHVCGGKSPEEIQKLIKQKDQMLEDMAKLATALNEYVESEEQGLLIKLPPDGQIYHIEESEETGERWIGNKPCCYITSEGYYCGWGIGTICFKFDELGKTVFLTREEAEAKLKGSEQG